MRAAALVTATPYRHETPPQRMRSLPVDARGYVVPWFVAWVDGVPHFEAIRTNGIMRAVNERRCWLCGESTGRYLAFVLGPMCTVNRVISEPPSHLQCAQFAARICPFLSNPRMGRIPEGKALEGIAAAGVGLKRNPGCAVVWVTTSFRLFRVTAEHGANAGILFRVGEPTTVEWYVEGRRATRAEVLEAIARGLPALREVAEQQEREEPESGALGALDDAVQSTMALVPA